jgi:hypothetical protein
VPNLKTSKDIAEDALRYVGAFPPSQTQADAAELKVALRFLETILQYHVGVRPALGTWATIDIPLVASKSEYKITDHMDEDWAAEVFSIGVVGTNGDYDPLTLLGADDFVKLPTASGTPIYYKNSILVAPVISVNPTPVAADVTAGNVLRVRIQKYQVATDPTGIADNDLNLRPSWHLWATNAVAYEIGKSPVRRLPEGELARFEKDRDRYEAALLAKDGQEKQVRICEPNIYQ